MNLALTDDERVWCESLWPGLVSTDYEKTSKQTPIYNCIAWAAGESNRWWWPASGSYWPEAAPREPTLTAFVEAFQLFGYQRCEDVDHEPGYERVAIFAGPDGVPTHAARQLQAGHWTSKCGKGIDIRHELEALSGNQYGTVAVVLRRRQRSD